MGAVLFLTVYWVVEWWTRKRELAKIDARIDRFAKATEELLKHNDHSIAARRQRAVGRKLPAKVVFRDAKEPGPTGATSSDTDEEMGLTAYEWYE